MTPRGAPVTQSASAASCVPRQQTARATSRQCDEIEARILSSVRFVHLPWLPMEPRRSIVLAAEPLSNRPIETGRNATDLVFCRASKHFCALLVFDSSAAPKVAHFPENHTSHGNLVMYIPIQVPFPLFFLLPHMKPPWGVHTTTYIYSRMGKQRPS